MMKKNLLFIWMLTMVLLVGVVSAVDYDTDLEAMIPLSNISESTGLIDLSDNNHNATAYNGVTFISDSSAFDFDGSDDYVRTPTIFSGLDSTTTLTVSAWVNEDVSVPNGQVVSLANSNNNYRFYLGMLSNKPRLLIGDGTDYLYQTADDAIGLNDWHLVSGTWDVTNGITLYVDGIEVSSTGGTAGTVNNIGTSNAYLTMGARYNTPQDFFNGGMSDVKVFNTELTSTEVSDLYDEGRNFNPFTEEPVTKQSSTESTSSIFQSGSVSFSQSTTILSATFNVTNNDTPIYGSYSFNVEANNDNELTCDLLIDGVSKGDITRSNTKNVKGSVHLNSDVFILDSGEHTQTLDCEKSDGAGLITIDSAVGIGHFLVDEYNNTLKYNSTVIIDEAVTSGNSYTLLDSFDITIGDTLNDGDLYHSIVVEGDLTYSNDDSLDILTTYIDIDGTNCTAYPRTVSGGGSGSVSLDCVLENVTPSTTYTVSVYGDGDDAVYNGNFVAKDLYLDDLEIVGGTGILTNYVFENDAWTKVINVTGGNINHAVANVFNKLSYSVLTDEDTTVEFYINITDGDSYTTRTWSRDYEAGSIGVIIGQEILEGLPIDTYEVELWANCGTDGASCLITGGSSLGYVTDVTTVILNDFNITASNYWDNSSILNFTVDNGATYTTTNGVVEYFTSDEEVNFTVSNPDYFSTSVVNHDVNDDINVVLKQSDVKFTASEIITGDVITPANFTIDGVNKGVNESFYLSEGTYNVTFSKNGWYDTVQEFSVTALDNKTINVDDVSESVISITAKHFIDNSSVTNFSGYIYHTPTFTNISFSTTNGTALVSAVNNTEFLIHIESDGFASVDDSFTVDTVPVYNYETSFYSFNSVYITIKDLFSGSLINQEVGIELISDLYSNTTSTLNGTKYLTVLNPEDYELRFTSSGYVTSSYFIAVSNDSSQDLNVFLLNNSNTYNVTVNIIDESAQNIEGAVVKASRYDIDSNTFILYSSGTTNSDGDVVMSLTYNDEYYKFTVEVDGVTKKVTSPQYITGTTLVIQTVLSDIAGSDFFNYLGVDTSLVYNSVSGNFRFDYNDIDGLGDSYCLNVYKETVLGNTLINSSCSGSSSGTILVGLTPLDNTLYVAKAYADDVFLVSESYSIPTEGTTGELGLFWQLMITIAFGMIAFKDLGLMPIALGASLIFGKIVFLNSFGWPGIAAFMVIMIVVSAGMYGFRG